MQLSDVVLVYFVIGGVMVGAGALDLGQAGLVNFILQEDDSGDLETTNNATNQIGQTGGAISTVVSLAVGGALLVWNFLQSLFAYLNWPIIVLIQQNAPPMAILLLGGSFTLSFYMAIAGILWRAT